MGDKTTEVLDTLSLGKLIIEISKDIGCPQKVKSVLERVLSFAVLARVVTHS
jgi:hypothetical protein